MHPPTYTHPPTYPDRPTPAPRTPRPRPRTPRPRPQREKGRGRTHAPAAHHHAAWVDQAAVVVTGLVAVVVPAARPRRRDIAHRAVRHSGLRPGGRGTRGGGCRVSRAALARSGDLPAPTGLAHIAVRDAVPAADRCPHPRANHFAALLRGRRRDGGDYTDAGANRDVLLPEAARQRVARVAVVDPAGACPVEHAVAHSAITLDAGGAGDAEAAA